MLSCQQDIPMVSLGIDNVYAIERMKALILHPEFPGERYEWSMIDSQGKDSLVSTPRLYFSKCYHWTISDKTAHR